MGYPLSMKYVEYTEKLQLIRDWAEHHSTGSPAQLALKLDVSERTVQRMVQQLRNKGFPIKFNRFRNSYEIRKQQRTSNVKNRR